MNRRENIRRRSEVLTKFRSSLGIPVGCEISLGTDSVILSSVEVEGSSGVRILSQVDVDEQEVLLTYRRWRSEPENRGRIRRFRSDLTECSDNNPL